MRRLHDGGTRTTRRGGTKHNSSSPRKRGDPWGIAARRHVQEAKKKP